MRGPVGRPGTAPPDNDGDIMVVTVVTMVVVGTDKAGMADGQSGKEYHLNGFLIAYPVAASLPRCCCRDRQ